MFEGVAFHGKGTMGWSYGFKLHFIINHLGEIVALKLTKGNEDDRKPVLEMADSIWGKLYGDKGYISKALTGELLDKGIELITTVRKNMKKKFISVVGQSHAEKALYNRDGKRQVEEHIVYRTLTTPRHFVIDCINTIHYAWLHY